MKLKSKYDCEEGQIIFGNIVNKALENLTNLLKYDIWYNLILDWYKIQGTYTSF